MTYTVRRSAIVPFAAGKMYRLVADIQSYPDFLNWCSSSEIVEDTDGEVVASLAIDFRGVSKRFTTRNRMHPDSRIDMSLVEGPFSRFKGSWRFTPLGPDASKIELDVAFDFDSALAAKVVAPLFSYIANHQVEAFERRARDLYG